MRLGVFVAAFLVLSGGLAGLHQLPFIADIFSEADTIRLERASVLPGKDIVKLKLRHGIAQQIDVALFGNSRIISVGASDLEIGGRSFFNFAIGGSGLRNSVEMLSALFRDGRPPELAIISMNNLDFHTYPAADSLVGSSGKNRGLELLRNGRGELDRFHEGLESSGSLVTRLFCFPGPAATCSIHRRIQPGWQQSTAGPKR